MSEPEQTTDGPGYWMYDTSGVLRRVIEVYLSDDAMTLEHIAAMGAYLRQWIGSSVWDQNPHAGAEERDWLARMRGEVDGLTTRSAIKKWIDAAIEGGMDPL